MTEQISRPSPEQQDFDMQVGRARKVTAEVGAKDVDLMDPNIARVETMRVGYDNAPTLEYKKDKNGGEAGYSKRVDGRVTKDTAEISTDYHSYSIERHDGEQTGAVTVRRYDKATGEEVYSHRFTNPKTAHKFGALIAKQVADRADQRRISSAEKAA